MLKSVVRYLYVQMVCFFIIPAAAIAATAPNSVKGASSSGTSLNDVTRNVTGVMDGVPGLLSSLSYIIGMGMAFVGALRVKDHYDNPTQTPLRDGTIQLITGVSLFLIPLIFELVQNTMAVSETVVGPSQLEKPEPKKTKA